MKLKWSALALCWCWIASTIASENKLIVNGVGATFPATLYAKWAEEYNKEHPAVEIQYQAIGSGGGIKQISENKVDFGATDKPLTVSELDNKGLLQFPTVVGAVVPVVNLAGVKPGKLKLTGPILAEIFLGLITEWNDPKLVALNPSLKLPQKKITVVHRADPSGTTYLLTNYLSKVSTIWSEKIGNDASVQWPVGVGGKGNQGVANYVEQIDGSIGYVELSYAILKKMSYTKLKNSQDAFVKPTMMSVRSAAQYADWDRPEMMLTNQPGRDSWPIVGATFILIKKKVPDDKVEHTKAVLDFFHWSFKEGLNYALELQYTTLPAPVVRDIFEQWSTTIVDDEGKVLWRD